MDKRQRTYGLLLLAICAGLFTACSKSEIRTNKLMKQGTWHMTTLKTGSSEIEFLPAWEIGSSEDYTQFAPAVWVHYDGSKANFLWRFNHYEGTFEFKVKKVTGQESLSKAYMQCDNLSGVYTVQTEKSDLFEFESFETIGYEGLQVFIQIQAN